jgi:uncharacterized protein YbjT (DUF2867 family)
MGFTESQSTASCSEENIICPRDSNRTSFDWRSHSRGKRTRGWGLVAFRLVMLLQISPCVAFCGAGGAVLGGRNLETMSMPEDISCRSLGLGGDSTLGALGTSEGYTSSPLWAGKKSLHEDDEEESGNQQTFGRLEKKESTCGEAKQKNTFLESVQQTLKSVPDPYGAGYQFRRTLDSALTTLTGTSSKEISEFYLNDRLFALEKNIREYDPDSVPEVLVVGATNMLGQLVVQKLLLRGIRVRVLVPNLYSSTLNLFGTNVVYCQGDLSNVESLEYALTDVDKIVFCAGDVNLTASADQVSSAGADISSDATEETFITGMNNLLHAYQNVRFVDYGAGQAAKRTLFKFKSRPNDIQLFEIERSIDESNAPASNLELDEANQETGIMSKKENPQGKRRRNAEWCSWTKNKFGNAVFFGRVATPDPAKGVTGGEAAIASTRLRARSKKPRQKTATNDDAMDIDHNELPVDGIDLSSGFDGFVVRLCGDGGAYQFFVRNSAYDTMGVEYIFDFATLNKVNGTKVVNKFQSVRMPFAQFKPVMHRQGADEFYVEDEAIQDVLSRLPKFEGRDVRQVGFRFSSQNNVEEELGEILRGWGTKPRRPTQGFYLAISYLKLFRSHYEPEFVFLSDSRIPPVVTPKMVRHDTKHILDQDQARLIDSSHVNAILVAEHEVLEGDQDLSIVYYKYQSEQMLRHSGLSYSIVRAPDFSDALTGDISTVVLGEAPPHQEATKGSNDVLLSRSDVADVCVGALLDPNALNKSFYIKKTHAVSADIKSFASLENGLSQKFSKIRPNS